MPIARLSFALGAAMILVASLFVSLGAVHAAPTPPGSIQSWIDAAPPGGTVNVVNGVYTESLLITKSLTLVGQSTSGTVLHPPAGARGIHITPGVAVRIERFTITGGQAPGGGGGGIWVEGATAGSHLTLVDSAVTDSSANYGGGIFQSDEGSVRIQASLLEHNRASIHGGGIFAHGSVFITNTNVISNSANSSGGGLAVWNGNVSLFGGQVAENYAGGNGGGVNANNDVFVNGTQFVRNTAVDAGGGVLQWNAGRELFMIGARMEANQAGTFGGGIWTRGIATIKNSGFYTNTTDWVRPAGPVWPEYTGGGAIYATSDGRPETRAGEVRVIASTFAGNRALCTAKNCDGLLGGAIYTWGVFTHTIESSRFERNNAWSGGAVCSNSATLIWDSEFVANTAGYGAAVSGAEADIVGSSFSSNSAVNEGGALSVGLRLGMERVIFTGNTAGAGGGAVNVGGDVIAENVLFAGNQSGWKGALRCCFRTASCARSNT